MNFGLTSPSVPRPEFNGWLERTSKRNTSPRKPRVVLKTRFHSILVSPEATDEPSPIEHAITRIWTEHLGEPLDRHDNFFAVGGYSLLAVRILAAIRDATRVELPFSTFVDYPTIAGQAAIVREQLVAQLSRGDADDLLERMGTGGRSRP